MVFSSTIFLFEFLPAILFFYFIGKKRNYRNTVLLIFSVAFYAWGEPLFVFVMIAGIILNWYLGLKTGNSEQHKKLFLSIAVICDVLILGIFKYLTFITRNIAFLAGNDNIIVKISLPIGISFFTFQMMSYVFDIYYKKAEPQKNPFYVLLYITMFPQLIAGPIVRYQTVEKEIHTRKETLAGFSEGMIRFSYGLGKKLLISNNLGVIADMTFASISDNSVCTAWLGAVCYTLQIYFDFSGYSDMAIGLGKVFGFSFPENFDYPYTAKSVTDFWRKWHISLSRWFRDYVYIPMGGNRVSKICWLRNLFIVWLLTGIWHGANWTFIVWGLVYFVFLVIEKLIGVEKIEKLGILSRIYVMLVVIFAWVIFRSDSLTEAVRYFGSLFGVGATSFCDDTFVKMLDSTKVVLVLSVILSFPVYGFIKKKIFGKYGDWADAFMAVTIFVISIISVVNTTYNPFIYFNF